MALKELKKSIRSIPDFPKKGILFRDITTLLNKPKAFKEAIDRLYKKYKDKKIDVVIAAEARGFIFAGALAYKLNCSFVPVRKKGKLPAKTLCATYGLEYGTDTLCIHRDGIKRGQRVLILDDLLATGGTARAMCNLAKKAGGIIVGVAFLIELADLKGRDKLSRYNIYAMIKY